MVKPITVNTKAMTVDESQRCTFSEVFWINHPEHHRIHSQQIVM